MFTEICSLQFQKLKKKNPSYKEEFMCIHRATDDVFGGQKLKDRLLLVVAGELEAQIATVGGCLPGIQKGKLMFGPFPSMSHLLGTQVLNNSSSETERTGSAKRRKKMTVKRRNLKGAKNPNPLTCSRC